MEGERSFVKVEVGMDNLTLEESNERLLEDVFKHLQEANTETLNRETLLKLACMGLLEQVYHLKLIVDSLGVDDEKLLAILKYSVERREQKDKEILERRKSNER